MGRYKISFDSRGLGVWTMLCDDSDVKEKTEAIIALGFEPEVEIVTGE